jgi:hypothetical protein
MDWLFAQGKNLVIRSDFGSIARDQGRIAAMHFVVTNPRESFD